MLMPSIFGENLFDDFFGDFPFYYDDRAMKDAEKKLYGHKANHVMKTDIKEMNNGYELIVDLPGFKKDEVHAALENGYLTISAEKGLDKDEKEKETGRYIRRERYAGACSRSFYVGKEVHQDDIKAEFKHGILTLFVPKKQSQQWNRSTASPLKDNRC
jgi:HSP20 family protein